MINQEPFRSARYLATRFHANQLYDDLPYIKHVEDVFNVLVFFNVNDPDILVASLLHDTIEDTNLTYAKIKSKFGKKVAELVYAVTNELGRNRKERHIKTIPKIIADTDAITLKLADRIANVNYSIVTKNDKKFQMYKNEYEEFRSEVYIHSNEKGSVMFNYLDSLMDFVNEDVRIV